MRKLLCTAVCALLCCVTIAQTRFRVTMENPASHYFHVEMEVEGLKTSATEFKIPVWTPGYYQKLNFQDGVENLKAEAGGKSLTVSKQEPNSWRVQNGAAKKIKISYDIKTVRPFVATPYIDEERAYISPPGVFLHEAGKIKQAIELTIVPHPKWNRVATGLDSVAGKRFTYKAPDFDTFYDSPILIGNLEELESFTVGGKKHRFIGYKLGDFDRKALMLDLKKIVEAASNIIGDIPYQHYTFIALGPGGGGIEHLNSTSVSFSGAGLNTAAGRLRMLNFLAHEYFHHYNVKRIRPIELGPFDYDNGSRTKMLWVSEGWSVYYEYLAVKRAGLCTDEELYQQFSNNLRAYENKPGRMFQSLTQSSYETWSDGPFGRTGDEVNKTISYYDKGPVIGLLFDFRIRNLTENKKSLDDLMRLLYNKYYLGLKRGFTEEEFHREAEQIAGDPLTELFEYVNTTKEVNYPKYFAYGGLSVDTVSYEVKGGWLGLSTRMRNDSALVTAIDWQSPAMKSGIKAGAQIVSIDGEKISKPVAVVLDTKQPGDKVELGYVQNGERKTLTVMLERKTEKTFRIQPAGNPGALQKQILQSWLGGK
jgi:predicted metalloprotease with PDZ domain